MSFNHQDCILYLQVFLGQSGGLDTEGNELPRLVYVSREKRPGFQHHKKAGAMNALVSVMCMVGYMDISYLYSCTCLTFGINITVAGSSISCSY